MSGDTHADRHWTGDTKDSGDKKAGRQCSGDTHVSDDKKAGRYCSGVRVGGGQAMRHAIVYHKESSFLTSVLA